MSKDGCPFCNPLESIVRSNDTALLFFSDPRKVPGHMLVVPKRHIEKPWEVTGQELKDIFELIYFVEKRVVGKLGEGVDIRQNYRPFITQNRLKLDHIHFQVIPRSNNDYLYEKVENHEADIFVELDDLEKESISKLFE